MGSSLPMEWDEWDCDCGGQSPPVFDLPPPPPPPDLYAAMLHAVPTSSGQDSWSGDCPALWTCPALLGARGEPAPSNSRLPVTLVVATAISLVILVIIIAAVVYRFRITRCRTAKNCTEMNGGIVYEDLPSAPPLLITPRGRTGSRYKPPLLHQHQLRHHLAERSLHVYTPEPHQLTTLGHHRYHSISSGGTETCSCSISETPSCALLPHAPSSDTSSAAPRPLLSSDDDTPTPSPYHYYAGQRRPSNSTLYESLYYTGSASSSRSSNSHSRALPPLPSRSDRFRIYFSNDRRATGGGATRGSARRQPHQRPSHEAVFVAPPPPEIEPLYENM
ncbi:uncharacterized protein LOC108680114 [Hyalella azteca]|uniref:Uncharacterized protein LOC108680114 n=1 Tax=Hyalella azteca TaxID=294128 RepID=A0A8B7PGC9_HYAAZ|nr:uncharacterized protein LOC108680114 [Hyalella azteca]